MRIALATVGTTGDVVPFAALARALGAGGHDVTAISWELHRRAFEEAGVSFAAAGPPTTWQEIAQTAHRAAAASSPLAQVVVLRDFHLRDAEDHYRRLLELIPGHDLVLLHGIHSLAEAATRDLGTRWASAVFDPVLLPTGSAAPAGMPSLGPFNRFGWWMLDRMLRRQDRPLRSALAKAGSASATSVTMFRARSPLAHLVACSPTIAPPPPDLAAGTHFTGAWTDSTAPAPLPAQVADFLAAGSPPIVVTFGSMAAPDPGSLVESAIAGARLAGRRVVLQVAGLIIDAAEDLLPIGRLDHRALFPRAGIVVHHGGAGTAYAAVAAGVPSVVIPHVGDQPFWAMRLHRLGVAPEPLPLKEVGPDAVRDRILAALTDPVPATAAEVGRRVAGEDGVRTAIGLLEEVSARV
ncbi:MAG TPA: glycosyltransferase [Candidatus Limnocylindria bacterium]|nr:glycosyltransferase [Candidatus Limnocylindria bacterium]